MVKQASSECSNAMCVSGSECLLVGLVKGKRRGEPCSMPCQCSYHSTSSIRTPNIAVSSSNNAPCRVDSTLFSASFLSRSVSVAVRVYNVCTLYIVHTQRQTPRPDMLLAHSHRHILRYQHFTDNFKTNGRGIDFLIFDINAVNHG